MKTIVVLEGPGFSEQGDVQRGLGFTGARLAQKVLGPDIERDLAAAEGVIIRGPWSESPEERLLVSTMARRLAPVLRDNRKLSVLAVGRGALIALEILFGSSLRWQADAKVASRWQRLKEAGPEARPLMGLTLGRASPVVPDRTPDGLSVRPWFNRENGDAAAWIVGGRFLISPLDILAYAERTQLPDFGYSDLTQILTQSQILDQFVRGEIQ